MFYDSDLRLIRDILAKNHVQCMVIDPTMPITQAMSSALSTLPSVIGDGQRRFAEVFPHIESHTIYKVTDTFACRYLFLQLPESDRVLVVGPYIFRDIERRAFLEMGERAGLDPSQIATLERYYAGLPLVISEESYIFSMVNTLGERLWGANNFSMREIDHGDGGTLLRAVPSGTTVADAGWNVQMMEQRYAYENEMMEAISHGHLHKAEQMLTSFSTLSFESRAADPLRNLKNYCIICNTLFRKAAQNGGVHPVHLDALSSDYAKRIELLTSPDQAQPLMFEMFRSYCRLVRECATQQYSPTVQRVILSIDADLTADLSLAALARQNRVSAGYLSALFRRETGETLTAYVNRRRVENAKALLKTTRLQIQTIAQHCGIVDVHYFTKLFKAHTGTTPKEYRAKRNP